VRQAIIERELQSARELQQVLIPEVLPELEGYKLERRTEKFLFLHVASKWLS
jgi:hypothetical protein